MASVVPCINDHSDGIAVKMEFRLGHNNENRFPLSFPHWFIRKVDLKTHRHMYEGHQEISASRVIPPGSWKDSGSLKADGPTDSSHSEGFAGVNITNCPKLLRVEGLEELRGIKFFKINECPSLQKVDFRHTSSSGEDKADMPQPGYYLDSAEEAFLVEQMDLCIEFEPYQVKKLI